MQMARPLPLPLLGFGGFPKLIEPRPIPLDKIPLWAVSFPKGGRLILPGLDLRGCVSHPSSQRGLRLLSGTPQRAMQPLKVATGVLSWEKAPTTEKHFLVILASTTQFHLGDQGRAFRANTSSLVGVWVAFLSTASTGASSFPLDFLLLTRRRLRPEGTAAG